MRSGAGSTRLTSRDCICTGLASSELSCLVPFILHLKVQEFVETLPQHVLQYKDLCSIFLN